MEVDGMVPWQTTFLWKQEVFHFHVMCSECNLNPEIENHQRHSGMPNEGEHVWSQLAFVRDLSMATCRWQSHRCLWCLGTWIKSLHRIYMHTSNQLIMGGKLI